MANIYPTKEDYESYWTGQQRRSKRRADTAISPIFSDARDRVTGNTLAALNNRRYLRIDDPRRRLVAVRRDPKISQIEGIIARAAHRSLQSIFDNLGPHYEEEIPMICKDLYPWTDEIGSCSASLSKRELAGMRQEPFLGRTYREWIIINRNNAIKSWNNAFRAVMIGDIRTENKVSRDAQLVTEIRKILNTQESRTKTVFENAMIQTSRKGQVDVEAALWP